MNGGFPMSENKEELNVEVESSESETTVVVTDSENYSETQKLKQIFSLKKRVEEHITDRFELEKEYRKEFNNPKYVYRERLADTTALYVNEVLPLLKSADNISMEDFDVGSLNKDLNVAHFGENQGIEVSNGEAEPFGVSNSKAVFYRTNELLREIGLGVELQEETEPASI